MRDMIAGVDTRGLPGELVVALKEADVRERASMLRVLTEVVDAHRRADAFAQRMFGNADPRPGEEPGEYEARIERLWDEWIAAHPEWLGVRAREREPMWLERAIAHARVRMGIAAADVALAHAGDADFMDRVKAAQPVIHEATVAMIELQEQRRQLAASRVRARVVPRIACPRCGMVSSNPNDIREGYCGNCCDWTGARDPGVPRDLGVPRDPGVPRDAAHSGLEFMGNGQERVYGVCRAERGPYACVLDEDHPPPHSAGRGVTWEDKVPLRRRVARWLRGCDGRARTEDAGG